jgi:hypothetical protein
MNEPKLETRNLLSKAVFAVGIVAIAAIVGAVHFVQAATPTDSSSGYGTSSATDVAAANTFETALINQTNTFTDQVTALQQQAESQLSSGGVTDFSSFDSQYNDATSIYASTVSQAFDTFRSQVMSFANTAVSKDQFIDEFNNAKANYLNSLQAAKNQLANSLSQLSGNGNVVKDQFIDGFNNDSADYSNNLEQAKNDFAAVLG